MLIQSQAAFLSSVLETDRAASEQFARIEHDMAEIIRVLAELGRLLQVLPEAIRDKLTTDRTPPFSSG